MSTCMSGCPSIYISYHNHLLGIITTGNTLSIWFVNRRNVFLIIQITPQNSICFHPHLNIHIRVPFWFDRCLPLTWIIIIIACVGVLRRILNHDCLMSLADTLYYSTTGPVFHSSPGGQWMTKLPLSLCNEYNNTIAWMSPRWWLLITGIVAPNKWMRLEIMCPPTTPRTRKPLEHTI